GRFDTARGDLVLEPIRPAEPGAITPRPEGLRVSGLGQAGAALKVEGGLDGDLAVLDRGLATWTGGAPFGMAGVLVARVSALRDDGGPLRISARLDAPD